MDYLETLGSLALASRMKRLVDHFRKEVEQIYKTLDLNFETSLMPIIQLVDQYGSVQIGQAASDLKISQPAVTQFCNRLEARGLVKIKNSPDDQRKREVSLTQEGKQLIHSLRPIWDIMESEINSMMKQTDHHLMDAMENMEIQLSTNERFSKRVLDQLNDTRNEIEFLEFNDSLAPHFEELNRDWIEKHFEMEPSDKRLLLRPKESIIDKGGFIYFAKLNNEIVGTVALIKVNDHVFELGKMAVSPDHQKSGIGKAMLDHVIAEAKVKGLDKLVLYSNTNLAPAINMYFKRGFRVIPKSDHHNIRANIKMEMPLND